MSYKYKFDQSQRDKKYRKSISNHCVYLFELSDHRIYIGSTDLFSYRLNTHYQKSKNRKTSKLYNAINESGGWEKVKIHLLVKDIPNRELRLSIEQYFISIIPKVLLLNTRMKCI